MTSSNYGRLLRLRGGTIQRAVFVGLLVAAWLGIPLLAQAGMFSQHSITLDERSHAYDLYIPATLPADRASAVIALHSGNGNAASFEATAGLRAAADQHGFVLIMPQGMPRPAHPNRRTWNAGAFPVHAAQLGVDHVGALRAILDDVEASIAIDPGRVYALGHSNGGMMAYRLACEASDMVAAIAVAAATLMDRDISLVPPAVIFDCTPEIPVAVLHYHGLLDSCAPFFGGPSTGLVPGVRPPVSDSIQRFVTLNQCGTVVADQTGQASCWTFGNCSQSVEVEICAIAGHGHAWPGALQLPPSGGLCSGPVRDDVGIDRILAFFSQHARVD